MMSFVEIRMYDKNVIFVLQLVCDNCLVDPTA